MENNDSKLQEQAAPLKNHDNAFVQVGKDGQPVIPQSTDKEKESKEESEKITTLDKR